MLGRTSETVAKTLLYYVQFSAEKTALQATVIPAGIAGILNTRMLPVESPYTLDPSNPSRGDAA